MIVAGFGFTTSATGRSLSQALRATGYDGPVDQLATASDKATARAMLDFSGQTGLAVAAVPARQLEAAEPRTQSPISTQLRRTGSVAEAAALAAAGPGATLITPRHISDDRMATCAIAEGPNP